MREWITKLFIVWLCGPSGSAESAEQSVPSDWPVGASARYQVDWQRSSRGYRHDLNTLAQGERAQLTADLNVTGNSARYLSLSWLPSPRPPTPASGSDERALGHALWLHMLAMPLNLRLDRQQNELLLDNASLLRGDLREQIDKALQSVGLDDPCTSASSNALCRLVSEDAQTANWVTQSVSPLFNCIGVVIDHDAAVEWRTSADIGQGFSMEITGSIRVRAAETSDQRLVFEVRETRDPRAGAEADPSLRTYFDPFAIETVTVCQVDRESGWPIEIEHRQTGAVGHLYAGIEIATFRRITERP